MTASPPTTATGVTRIATYRLQFSPTFHFRNALDLLPYLRALGISHVYASPIARPHPGSTHGYDVCDPTEVNPELGSDEELMELLQAVRDAGMGWVQDIVPNHMAVNMHNLYWRDVLRFGQRSQWAFLFDIDWEHPDLEGRILVPILGEPYARVLASGGFRLTWEAHGPVLAYAEHRLPLSPSSVAPLLQEAGVTSNVVVELMALDTLTNATERSARMRSSETLTGIEHSVVSAALERVRDPVVIDRLIRAQAWQPAWWRTGNEITGYRRFFAVNGLIAIRMEDPRAFDAMHALTFRLFDLGLISGVRVDHIDGLRDPADYLQRLRTRLPGAWILVEKILGHDEQLPPWSIDGTTGYEVLNALTGVVCDRGSAESWTRLYQELTGAPADPTHLTTGLRQDVDRLALGGDLDRTVAALRRTTGCSTLLRDIGRRTLRDALRSLLAHLTVYRTYGSDRGGSPQDFRVLGEARTAAVAAQPDLAPAIDTIVELLFAALQPEAPPALREALARVQHLSGPAMAKGWEDTFLFRWSRCLALNEVGSDPRRFGKSPVEFMRFAIQRSPTGGLNTTSTHDTKRGEDVRARLAAMTWHTEAWSEAVREWFADHERWFIILEGGPAPSCEERYQLYQTLVGTWPADGRVDATYRERILACALKSARESGHHTSWAAPHAAYESALAEWLGNLLDPVLGERFQHQLSALVQRIAAHAGALGLIQTVLKCTMPGVPDIYQGAEWHDRSLVDPDNRRAVDFASQRAALEGHAHAPMTFVLDSPLLKQHLLMHLLRARQAHPDALVEGTCGNCRWSAVTATPSPSCGVPYGAR